MKKTTSVENLTDTTSATSPTETTNKKPRKRAKTDIAKVATSTKDTNKTTTRTSEVKQVGKQKATTKKSSNTSGTAVTKKTTPKRTGSKKLLSKSQVNSVPRQTILEFIQREDGTMALQERNSDEVLVTINFGEIIKDMMGADNIPIIGHHMIQAAISHMMQEQMSRYHAQVYDEPMARFS